MGMTKFGSGEVLPEPEGGRMYDTDTTQGLADRERAREDTYVEDGHETSRDDEPRGR